MRHSHLNLSALLNLTGVHYASPLCSHAGLVQRERLRKAFLFKHLRGWLGFFKRSDLVQKGGSPSLSSSILFKFPPLVDQEVDKWHNQIYCSEANESVDKD